MEGDRGFAATKPAPFGLQMSLCPLGEGCWGAPRCRSAPSAPGRCWSQPDHRDVPGPVPCSAAPRAGVSVGAGAWGGCGNSAASHGEGAFEICPCPGAWLLGCCRAPGRGGAAQAPVGAGTAGSNGPLRGQELHPCPCHRPHPILIPIPVRPGSPLEPGTGTFITFIPPKPSMQSQSQAQQLLSSPRKLGSAPCAFPHASLCV